MNQLSQHRSSNASPARKVTPFFPAKHAPIGTFFQPKLTVGPTDDVCEKEADAVADKVMRMEVQPEHSHSSVQRTCAECAKEEEQEH